MSTFEGSDLTPIHVLYLGSPPWSPSNYYVELQIGATRKIAVLTRDAAGRIPGRCIALLPESEISNALSPTHSAAILQLRTRLQLEGGKGRFRATKQIIPDVMNRRIPIPGIFCVTHRYGPVAVILIPTDCVLPSGESLFLGVYPSSDLPARRLPPGVSSTPELLDSLNGCLDSVMLRYFEDVAAIFHSIIERGSLSRGLRWCKDVETTLSESVKSKLKRIIPENGAYHGAAIRRRALMLQERYRSTIIQSKYLRLLSLYLVNTLYEEVGLRSKKRVYDEKLKNFERSFPSEFPKKWIDQAFSTDADLFAISRIYAALSDPSSEDDALRDLAVIARRDGWIGGIGRFAAFISLLKAYGTPSGLSSLVTRDPRVPNIFVSANHAVAVADQIRDGLQRLVDTGGVEKAQLLYVKEGPGQGIDFESVIRCRIWLSDGLKVIVPAVRTRYDGTITNYTWIGEEAAAAKWLEKEVEFCVQDGTANTAVTEDFSKVTSRLFQEMPAETARSILDRDYRVLVHGAFQIHDSNQPLDERLIRQFRSFVRRVAEQRTEHVLKGYLRQLPISVLSAMSKLRLVNNVYADWANHLLKPDAKDSSNHPSFQWLFEASTSRALIIDGRELTLFTTHRVKRRKKYKYAWNLQEIMRRLRPWATQVGIIEWERNMLAWAVEGARRRRLDLVH